jgi:hypothetical protein
MNKKIRIIIPLLVPIVSLIYAVGDYSNWWDKLSGRTAALEGVQRLASPRNYPDIIIFDDEAEFKNLFSYIISKTDNKEVIHLYRKGIFPTAILRVGGTLKPDVGDNLPDGWPNPKFAPASSPIGFAYGHSRPPGKLDGSNLKPIGSLGDLRQWINDSRNRERFILASVLIGVLSLTVAFLDLSKGKS